jgi:hypothetical protein
MRRDREDMPNRAGLPDLRIDESFGARLAYSFSLSFV